MRLTSAIIATAGALAFAGVATANDNHGAKSAKVYRATLVTADAVKLPDVKGKAQLVDGKKNNKISIHVRGLQPGATYTWHIHKAANDTDDPCKPTQPVVDGTPFGDWQYGALVANEDGNASAKGKSATFDSRTDPGPFYVDVHQADGSMLACGVLEPSKKHGKHAHGDKQPEPRNGKESLGQGQGHEPGHGRDD
jgi:hypothetical protein